MNYLIVSTKVQMIDTPVWYHLRLLFHFLWNNIMFSSDRIYFRKKKLKKHNFQETYNKCYIILANLYCIKVKSAWKERVVFISDNMKNKEEK